MASTQTIFEQSSQAMMDLGQTIQHPMEFPATLAERYQPRKMADFIGLARPKQLLSRLAANPKPCALLFVGPPGAGKTALAMAFAEELPGTLHHVSAQKCDVAALDALNDKFAYMPPVGNFWVCLIDEADEMTEKAQLQMLSKLDGTAALKPKFGGGVERGTPPPVIWIFTCNGRGTNQTDPPLILAPRFVSRCMVAAFDAAPQPSIASYLQKIWLLEGGDEVPAGWFDFIADGVGVRDALMRLDVDLLAGPREIVVPSIEVITPKPQIEADRSVSVLKAWATRRAKQLEKDKRKR